MRWEVVQESLHAFGIGVAGVGHCDRMPPGRRGGLQEAVAGARSNVEVAGVVASAMNGYD
ncbi:hypothetical protein ABIF00_006732 [Bradyrhizobium elkanii]